MPDATPPARTRLLLLRGSRALPIAAFTAVVATFLLLPALTSDRIAEFDVFNSFQGFASVGLITLAVGLTMVAGEFDLSVAGMQALGGVLAVKLGGAHGLLGVLGAVAACSALGAAQGKAIAAFRISSMPVTLGTSIALLGLTNVIARGDSLTYGNTGASVWVDQQLTGWISARAAIAVGAFLVVSVLLGTTRLGAELRAVGADRRAARVVGIRVDRCLTAVFAASGALAAGGGAMLAYSNSSASLDPGLQPLILAVAGAVLGGVSLTGGRGTIWGLMLGAAAVCLLQEIFAIASLASSTTQLVFGGLLLAVVIIDAPGLRTASARLARSQEGATTTS